MCFLKQYKSLEQISIQLQRINKTTPFTKKSIGDHNASISTNQQNMIESPSMNILDNPLLFRIMQSLLSNSCQLSQLEQKIQAELEELKKSQTEIEGAAMNKLARPALCISQTQMSNDESSDDVEQKNQDPLLKKLFGVKKYRYRLKMTQNFPKQILKERNFDIKVLLLDQKEEKALNSNIIHLCLGICDSNGEWIIQNKAGEPALKGRTEVEMYHGEASFSKVYSRELSRGYSNGKLNFVVYSKASLLKFSGCNSSLQKVVDSSLVEPLVIRDISIRAKKKE